MTATMRRPARVLTFPHVNKPLLVLRRKSKRLGRKPASLAQYRQRELSWMLYITEGSIANMEKALRVNCVTFTNADHDAVAEMCSELRDHAERLRDLLGNIEA